MGAKSDKNERADRPVNQNYGKISRSTRNVEGILFLELLLHATLIQAKGPNSGCRIRNRGLF